MSDEVKEYGKIVVSHCEPLYLSKHFMQDGHSAEKANGTVTYVKYKNVTYGITCAHVYFHQKLGSSEEKILTVFGDRIVYQFGTHLSEGYRSHFRSLRASSNDTQNPDIAIVQLAEPYPSFHMHRKGKKAIDLDYWVEPNLKDVNIAMACGFPTEHKSQNDSTVSAKLAQVFAEPASSLNLERESFLLASSLEEDCTIYFSGMSGGPVYLEGADGQEITLIGIVYEGSPGSSKEWENRGNESFLTRKDIQIRAYTLTPEIFEDWLREVGYL
ncbi:MAG: hypothetical protein GYB21_01425 [Oceanospirillales bacterium]|nr:hypothetical protein [Oceanospirillales bacterium]